MSRSAEARYELKQAANEASAQFWQHQQQQQYYYQGYTGTTLHAAPTPSVLAQTQVSYLQAQGQYVGSEVDDPQWRLTRKMEMHGNRETYNLNSLLANCIMTHDYTKRLWEMGESFRGLVSEAKENVKHVEPWQQGTQRTPSTAFCLLLRLFQLGLHEGHVRHLLSSNFPQLRCLGYLYLRYVCPPADLWRWCEAGLYDDIQSIPGSDQALNRWLRKLLTDQKYYGTILPRIPVLIDRDIRVKLILVDEADARAKKNARLLPLENGPTIKAIYADDANEPAWYTAVIDAPDDANTSKPPEHAKFWVTFPEYGNTELLRIGDLDLSSLDPGLAEDDDDDHRRSDDRRKNRHRSRSRSRRDRKRRRRDDDSDDDRDRHRRRRDRRDDDSDRRRDRRDDDSDGERRRDDDSDDDRDRRRRRRDRRDDDTDDQPRNGESLLAGGRLQKVIAQQRAAASSSSDYARRPPGYKEALALKADRYTHRRRSPSPDRHKSSINDAIHDYSTK